MMLMPIDHVSGADFKQKQPKTNVIRISPCKKGKVGGSRKATSARHKGTTTEVKYMHNLKKQSAKTTDNPEEMQSPVFRNQIYPGTQNGTNDVSPEEIDALVCQPDSQETDLHSKESFNTEKIRRDNLVSNYGGNVVLQQNNQLLDDTDSVQV